jgi:hypothetical protein
VSILAKSRDVDRGLSSAGRRRRGGPSLAVAFFGGEPGAAKELESLVGDAGPPRARGRFGDPGVVVTVTRMPGALPDSWRRASAACVAKFCDAAS